MKFEQDDTVVSISQNDNEEDDMILRMLRFLGEYEEAENMKQLRLVPAPRNS